MKNYFIIILILILPIVIKSQEISKSKAYKVAENFLIEKQFQHFKKTPQAIALEEKTNPSFENIFYIFNIKNQKGFVIVSANSKTVPILAYSLENNFPAENLPPEVEEWLNIYKQQIKHAAKLKIIPQSYITKAWKKYSSETFSPENNQLKTTKASSVSPLLSVTWNQGIYYNELCPETTTGGSGGHVWAGCVATAMAQVMKYWSYPEYGRGEHSYTHPDYGEQYADFENTNYKWNNMPASLSSHNLDVATLIYHCGVSVNMKYSPTGSGAYSSTARNSLIQYFKYSSNALLTSKYFYTDENWRKMIISEINAGRPLFYTGHGSGGHAFNCDGYQDSTYFHFNWGWGGAYNGYYYLNDLTPGSANFTNSQSAIVGLQPETMNTKFDSLAAIDLSCSVAYHGNTSDGSNIANLYSVANTHETGKEKIHKITTVYPGRITAKLTGMSEDLDVFILKYADRNSALAYGDSIAYLDDTEPDTYYIVVDGHYAAEGDYTLTVICPDIKADLIAENAKVSPIYVEAGQNFLLNYEIKNIGNKAADSSVVKYFLSFDQTYSNDDVFIDSNIIGPLLEKSAVKLETHLTMPDIDTSGTLMYVLIQVDANNQIDETDEELNFTNAPVQIPRKGILDCSNAVVLNDGEKFSGNTALNGDSVIDNYSCNWGLTNKEIVHRFTPEFSGMATIEFSESLEGTPYVLLLSSCNENSCINATSIWENGDTVISQDFYVSGGVTYYLVVDGNNNYGNSEGAYSLKVDFPEKCPKPTISFYTSLDRCEGDAPVYLNTNWEYPNFQWLKNSVEIPGANDMNYLASETAWYSVKVTQNGCTGTSDSVQVRYSPKPPDAIISATGDTAFCEGGSVLLQLNNNSGYTYQWTNDHIPIVGAEDLIYEAFQSGTYRIEVTNISCTIKSNPITVDVWHSAKQNGETLDMSKDSLFCWWSFDNWGTDESGNGYYAGIYGAYKTTDRFGAYTAYGFNGVDNYISTVNNFDHPDTFTVSLWFKTSESGKLIGFDEEQSDRPSSNYDRHLYIDSAGFIHFGVDNGTKNVIGSSQKYNDNQWHMATASLSPEGMKLYVDAIPVAQNNTVTNGADYRGYWKMAYGNLSGWANAPLTNYYKGKLDDVVIYKRSLSTDEIEVLYEDQKIKIYAENDVFCNASGNTNIIIENSEPGISYQLINAEDSTTIGSAVVGNSGNISLNTGNLTSTTHFKIYALNTETACNLYMDTVFTIYVDTVLSPVVQIISDKQGNESCLGDSVHFTANMQFGGTNPVLQWQINDVSTGTADTEFVTNALKNNDVVKFILRSSLDCATPKTVSDELIFTVHDLPDNSLSINGSTELCTGDTTSISANANADYEWYLTGENNPLDTTQTLFVNEAGNYYLKLENAFGCINYSDTVFFNLYPLPEFDLGEDTSIMSNQSLIIGTEDNFVDYLWNTGAKDNTILVEGNMGLGTYEFWLQVYDGHCYNTDTILITIEQVTGMNNVFSTAQIKVYPNPAKEHIVLDINNIQTDLNIELSDSKGKILWKKAYQENVFIYDKINVSHYPKGMYFIRFSTKQNSLIKKIIIE